MNEFEKSSKRSASNKEPIDLVLSGSGTKAPCFIGAVERLNKEFDVVRVAGTSGGGIVAAGIAAGYTTAQMMNLTQKVMSGEILDPQITIWNGYGVNKGDKMVRLLKANLPNRMDDLYIPWGCYAVDVETGMPVFFNSEDHGHLNVGEVVGASASIPFFFAQRKITGAKGLYIDGGISANFAMGTWDDMPERRTIGLHFSPTGVSRKPVKNFKQYTLRVLSVMSANASRTYLSEKNYQNSIRISTKGDGMDFDLSPEDLYELYQNGYDSVDEYLSRVQ